MPGTNKETSRDTKTAPGLYEGFTDTVNNHPIIYVCLVAIAAFSIGWKAHEELSPLPRPVPVPQSPEATTNWEYQDRLEAGQVEELLRLRKPYPANVIIRKSDSGYHVWYNNGDNFAGSGSYRIATVSKENYTSAIPEFGALLTSQTEQLIGFDDSGVIVLKWRQSADPK